MHDLEVSPQSVKIRNNAGVILMAQGQYEEALEQFGKAIEIRPQRIKSYRLSGDTLVRLQREDEAIVMYEKAFSMGSRNTMLLNNMGYVLVDSGIDVERGVRLIQKAVEKEPENPIFLDSLGWAYYKQGRIREGYDLIKKAIEVDDEGRFEKQLRPHLEELERVIAVAAHVVVRRHPVLTPRHLPAAPPP